MSEFKRYKEKAAVVEAMQITADTTVAEVREITRNGQVILEQVSPTRSCFRIPTISRAVLVFQDEWLTVDSRGEVNTFTDSRFHEVYGAVE